MKRVFIRDIFLASGGAPVNAALDEPSIPRAGFPTIARMRVSGSWGCGDGGPIPESKLKLIQEALCRVEHHLAWVPPAAISRADLCRVHDPLYVEGVLEGPPPSRPLGLPMPSGPQVFRELGACFAAADAALEDGVAAALTAGAHDAFWDSPGRSGPFNAWMVVVARLRAEGRVRRVAILDCSPQCGSGTESIIDRLGLGREIQHVSLGKRYQFRRQAQLYLARVRMLEHELRACRPDLLLYQASARSHAQAPVGGVLGTHQMLRRDATVFEVAARLGVPVAWNIDDGAPPAPPPAVALAVHLNTFREAWRSFATEPFC